MLKTLEKNVRRILANLPPEVATLIKAMISYVPGMMKHSDITHSIKPFYCYCAYLAHINQAHRVGLDPFPRVVAELGPGTSFGVGIAALLCGAEVYYAIDELPHARPEANLEALDQLVDLLRSKKDPLDETGTRKTLETFPSHILTDDILERNLNESRIRMIREAIIRSLQDGSNQQDGPIRIFYMCPFRGRQLLPPQSVDMIMSTVVMQVVMDLPEAYSCMAWWLKPGAWMSHFVDFSNYGMTTTWNGHWACSDLLWRLMQGARPYLHNRAPHSLHIRLMEQNGFEIVTDIKTYDYTGIDRKDLTPQFAGLTDDDLRTTRSLIQAVKK